MHLAVEKAVEMTDEEDTLIVVSADHSHVFTMGGYTKLTSDILGMLTIGDYTMLANHTLAILTIVDYTTLTNDILGMQTTGGFTNVISSDILGTYMFIVRERGVGG